MIDRKCCKEGRVLTVLLSGHDLFPRQVAAALGQYLVLQVCAGDAGANVVLDCTGDHDWTWEGGDHISSALGMSLAQNPLGFIHTAIASVHVCDKGRAKGVQVGNHVCVVSHIGQLGNSKVRLAEARSGRASTSLSS